MTTLHKNLTGTDLHEPKGASTATKGQVYRSNGAGSGTWLVIVPVGAIWDVVAATAPLGFHLCDGKTIGDASSGASARANADQADLFDAIWTTFGNTQFPILDSAGSASTRGLSSAADFAAHKRLPLPDLRERVTAGWDNLATATRLTGVTGSVLGDTAGATGGEETHTNTSAEMPSHHHTQQGTITSGAGSSHTHGAGTFAVSTTVNVTGGSSVLTALTKGSDFSLFGAASGAHNVFDDVNVSGPHTISITASLNSGTVTGTSGAEASHTHSVVLTGSTTDTGSGGAHNNVQPVFICPKIIFYGG